MKKTHLITENNDLFDAQDEIKDFLKEHKKKLTDEEHDDLGELLNRRAKAMSEVLGVEVSSVASPRKG